MRIEETSLLLAKIQAFDNRNVDEATLAAWFEILQPHTIADCLAAVTSYYRANTSWIMPAHVVERVRDTEQARVDSFGLQPHISDGEWKLGTDFGEASRALNRAVRTGRLDRATYEAYLESETPILEVLATKAITK